MRGFGGMFYPSYGYYGIIPAMAFGGLIGATLASAHHHDDRGNVYYVYNNKNDYWSDLVKVEFGTKAWARKPNNMTYKQYYGYLDKQY